MSLLASGNVTHVHNIGQCAISDSDVHINSLHTLMNDLLSFVCIVMLGFESNQRDAMSGRSCLAISLVIDVTGQIWDRYIESWKRVANRSKQADDAHVCQIIAHKMVEPRPSSFGSFHV